MVRQPPRYTRTYPLFPNPPLFRSFDLDPGVGAPDAVRMMYCDAVSYLPDDILCKVDRASMAVSLETRVPFLDHRVDELAARIPIETKIRSEEHTSELQSLMRISYDVYCLKKKKKNNTTQRQH